MAPGNRPAGVDPIRLQTVPLGGPSRPPSAAPSVTSTKISKPARHGIQTHGSIRTSTRSLTI